MMRQYELVERVTAYDPDADENLLNRAYVYAMKAHGDQVRASGDPYFSHPLEVAAILTKLKLDDATIATALLHDTIEDTDVTREEIDGLFGPEIGALVEGLTKIKKLDLVSKKAEQAENFRKLLVAITGDIRVLLVKLADRLHNMRTLQYVKPGKRKRIAEETMDIYAPLAARMGMQWMREELEDLAFKWLNPEAYSAVLEKLTGLREANSGLIEEIISALAEKFQAAGLDAQIKGRQKTPFATWSKMERKQIALEQLSDIFAFRIIVNDINACYAALGIIHTNWRSVPGRFKDYISTPKQNDYQSIHSTVIGPRHQRVELQIRTEDMHQIAEYGVAAHVAYKDTSNGANSQVNKRVLSHESNAYLWLRRLVDMLLEGDNPEEFLEHTKLELFQDQVFCFTPKGRLIALPRGATPIDFAYAVHTDVGNSCVGSRVNGRHVPLITELVNGDEVEIITSEAQTPPPAWEGIAITGKARSAIRRATRVAVRQQYGELGRQILRRAFARVEQEFDEKDIEPHLPRLSQKTLVDLYAAVGRGEMASDDVIHAMFPETSQDETDEEPKKLRRSSEDGWFSLKKAMGLKFRWTDNQNMSRPGEKNVVPVRGHRSDLPVRFGEGGAIPGDRIVGILTSGEGIVVYPIHSPKLKEFDDQPERWVDVTWDIDEDTDRFPISLEVIGLNEPGTLAQIANVIGDEGGNIDEIKMVHRAPDFTAMVICVEVFNLKHLNDIINGLTQISVVHSVTRIHCEDDPKLIPPNF